MKKVKLLLASAALSVLAACAPASAEPVGTVESILTDDNHLIVEFTKEEGVVRYSFPLDGDPSTDPFVIPPMEEALEVADVDVDPAGSGIEPGIPVGDTPSPVGEDVDAEESDSRVWAYLIGVLGYLEDKVTETGEKLDKMISEKSPPADPSATDEPVVDVVPEATTSAPE